MVDLFPYPQVDSTAPAEIQTQQLVKYLTMLKDELEFSIQSISDKEIQFTSAQINQINQMISDGLNIAEVVNSNEFKKAIASASVDIHLNLQTGCIEY